MILCVSEAVIDMFQKKNQGADDVFMPLPGGCCYNTSIAVRKLGVESAFLGRISENFFGDIQIKRLREYNVKENFIIRCKENPILAFIKTEEGKEPQYAFYDEGTADRLLSANEIKFCIQKNTNIKISAVVFGSVLTAMEPAASSIEKLIIKEAAKKTVIAFDPNIRPYFIRNKEAYIKRFKKWASLCTIAKISSEDFQYIFPETQPEEALKKMINLGTRLAIVTLGGKGAVALLKRGDGTVIRSYAEGIKNIKIADTVGAGDTFQGAFLAFLELNGKLSHNAVINLNEKDLNEALVFANKAAAIVCTRDGAQPPCLNEVENLKY